MISCQNCFYARQNIPFGSMLYFGYPMHHQKAIIHMKLIQNFAILPKKLLYRSQNLSVADRALNQEALVLLYCAEKNLSFARAGEIIDITKELSKDCKALNRTQLSRTTVSYKIKFGLGRFIEEKLISNLQETCFSLNIDEATSDTLQKILTSLFARIGKK